MVEFGARSDRSPTKRRAGKQERRGSKVFLVRLVNLSIDRAPALPSAKFKSVLHEDRLLFLA